MLRGSSPRTVNNQLQIRSEAACIRHQDPDPGCCCYLLPQFSRQLQCCRSYGETFKYLLHKSSFVLLSTRLSRGPAAAEQLLNKPHLSETGGHRPALH